MRPPRPALLNRYAIDLPLDLGDAIQRFVGTDVTTGQTVVIAFVARGMLELLARARGAMHRHLAGILAVVESPPSAAFAGLCNAAPVGPAVVAELVRGRSLEQVVGGEPVPMDRAVAWSIRILEALQVLHQHHSVHGAVTAHAIVAEPRGRAIPPVLSCLVAPPLFAYASRERLAGAGPSEADDLWAVGLLLLRMLGGKLAGTESGQSNVGVELARLSTSLFGAAPFGRELETILQCALADDPSYRPNSAGAFLELLDGWERRIPLAEIPTYATAKPPALSVSQPQPVAWDRLQPEFQDGCARLQAVLDAAENLRSVPPGVLERVVPPPSRSGVEASERAIVASPQRPKADPVRRRMPSITLELASFRKQSKPRPGKWLLVLLLLGAIAAASTYVFTQFSGRLAVSPAGSVAQSFLPSRSADTERPRLTARQEQAACIHSYFRPNSLVERADLDFVCSEEDLLIVNRRLHDELTVEPGLSVPNTNASVPSTAAVAEATAQKGMAGQGNSEAPYMIIRSGAAGKGWQLGWYELVATGIIRQNCCREAAPIRLPETTGWCQQLQTVVRRIAAESVKVGDISPGVRAFDEAITCLLAQGRHLSYPYKTAPTSAQKSAFQQFLKHAAEVDARRTGRR